MKTRFCLRNAITLLLATFLIITMIPLICMPVRASSSVDWEGTLPDKNALLNQTLTENTQSGDGVARLSLATNLYQFATGGIAGSGGYDLDIGVVAAANTRGDMSYSVYSFAGQTMFNFFGPQNIVTLSRNSGVWVSSALVCPEIELMFIF